MKASSTAIRVSAQCDTCRWSCSAANALAAGSQHAKTWRHTVKVEEHRTMWFLGGRRAPADADVEQTLNLGGV